MYLVNGPMELTFCKFQREKSLHLYIISLYVNTPMEYGTCTFEFPLVVETAQYGDHSAGESDWRERGSTGQAQTATRNCQTSCRQEG